MMLLFGTLNDEVMAYLVLRLLERRAPFVQLEPSNHFHGFELNWEITNGQLQGQLRYGEQLISLGEVRSVFARDVYRALATSAPSTDATNQSVYIPDPAWMLHDFIESAPLLVCNRFSACATNSSKIYQQRIIAEHGFCTPLTLTTNIPEDAKDFYQRCHGRTIYKSLSSVRSIVRRMENADLERLEQIRHCPVQFQEWVPGMDVRVHVVDQRLFATEVITEATDYRYAGREGMTRTMRDVRLPPNIEERCRKLTASLGLVTAGIDLRRSLDGEYYCFEANPNPGFTFYEQYTGQRIGDSIIDLLEFGKAA